MKFTSASCTLAPQTLMAVDQNYCLCPLDRKSVQLIRFIWEFRLFPVSRTQTSRRDDIIILPYFFFCPPARSRTVIHLFGLSAMASCALPSSPSELFRKCISFRFRLCKRLQIPGKHCRLKAEFYTLRIKVLAPGGVVSVRTCF